MNHLITYAGFTGSGLNYAHNEDVVVLRALTSGQGSSQAASAGPKCPPKSAQSDNGGSSQAASAGPKWRMAVI